MSHPFPNTISHSISNEFKDRTRSSWSWANEGNLPTRDRAVDKYKPPHIKALKDWASGKLIKVVNVSDLPYVEMSLKIERCEYLASYNWLDSPKDPIILIPGSPPLWSPSLSTRRLKEDSGQYFRDLNAARYPHHPIEPSFRALLAMHPDVDLSSFDIVGCGSTLGNLLRFCEGIDKDFRFDVDRVRDTVFFIRKESSPRALIPNICGYGHSFHEAHTIWEPDVKGSVSHQRIIQYHFGGLKFLVRSESDGYLKQAAGLDTQANDAETANAKDPPESEEDLVKAQQETEADNCALLEALRITEGPSSIVRPLRIEMRGRQIPQKAIFDLKTRAKETRRPIDMNEVYRRLWVNQTPYFMFAEHFRGFFEPRDIQPVSVSDGISKWEKDCEALLKHYQATVIEIMTATRSSVTGKLQVIRRGSGPLEIQERASEDNTDVLPHDLRSKW
ncbi:uncharacterized protein PAC_19794 [Phialocephala subalpina]|uniref:Geranylgeranyl pyrophosphate synthetase n=1 Tax=Phialocephala subalpina TaxID=576137 RepID=A0A1L7XY17_9HELO|nr:uncharacterized protein PAC_19794 [Phialocephala subalpina]